MLEVSYGLIRVYTKVWGRGIFLIVDNGLSALGDDAQFYRGMLSAYGFYAVKAAHIAKGVGTVPAHILLRAIPAMNRTIG